MLLVATLLLGLVGTACTDTIMPSHGASEEHGSEEPKAHAEPMMQDGIAVPEDVAAPPKNAERTASGIASRVLEAGKGGSKPGPRDSVTVHYSGWTTDGKMFDSSVRRGEPASFPLNQVIPGWSEGVQLMTLGEKRRLWIPQELAYRGQPGAPAGTLVFDIELLSFEAAPPEPTVETPADVAAPPDDAERTASGLASKVLEPGEGGDRPGAKDTVTVHYSGWTTDGKLFDSSIKRGSPMTFPLDRVIAGWTEGVQLMTKGEQRRFWIPVELAYQGRPGRPAGMLVFDIELLDFEKQVDPALLAAPDDVAAVPKGAKKTKSGLATKVITKGSGKTRPTSTQAVRVHYTGWTTDGKMFDSSVARGKPAILPLDRLIDGFSEGMQLMVVGEKRRMWIPEALAYQGQEGRPAGMLVYDVELLEIMQ